MNNEMFGLAKGLLKMLIEEQLALSKCVYLRQQL